jgi:ATP-binding cassette subfamily B protein RaxB
MIANYHGLDIDLGTMRRRFAVSLRGAPLRSLMTIADQVDLTTRAVKLPLEQLAGLQMPAILHWDLSHYVVVEKATDTRALIHDPAGQSKWMELDEISNHFTGVALELSPGERFEGGDQRQRLRLQRLWSRMTGIKRALIQTMLLSLVLQAFVLASPYYLQIIIDSALPTMDADLLVVLAVGFGIFTLINVSASFLRSYVLLIAGTSLGYGVATNMARRLFRLRVDWFEKREVGDILSRFQSIVPIQRLLTEGAVAAIIDGSLALFTLGLMFVYNASLAIVALIAFLLYASVRFLTFAPQRRAQEGAIVEHGKEQSILIETLRGITTLRMFGRETIRHAFWQTRLTDAVNADIRLARVGIWQQNSNLLIFGLENIISVLLAARAVMLGEGFSVGMIFAYLAYKTQFLQKSSSLIDQVTNFKMLGLHLERLSDIALSPEDDGFREGIDAFVALEGRIELRGIRYRYAPSDPLVLDGVNLVVGSGEHVAITGPSGGGKSTLVKIILGLLDPSEGEILIDGRAMQKFGRRNFQSQIAAVLQDDNLFAGTLSENIALFDENPDEYKIMQAAQNAIIHDDIMQMSMKYETRVGDMGSTLSGGQKQRILLARALYRKPRILIVDEGTAHLDSRYEAAVNAAIGALGITRIIIAHRRETVQAADRIMILDGGKMRPLTSVAALAQ